MKKARILIVDDHPIVRQGLVQLLNQTKDLIPCGEASRISQALSSVSSLQPDIAVVDISLGDESGFTLLENLQDQFPRLPVLILSLHEESHYAERALRSGAKGYIMKREASDKIVDAIRQILKGQLYFSEGVTAHLLNKIAGAPDRKKQFSIERLSSRELKVFKLVGQGFNTRHIADKLQLSIKTIETYYAHIKEKVTTHVSQAIIFGP